MDSDNKLTKHYIIIFLILSLPILNYIYLIFPDTRTADFFYFEISSNYYESVNVMIWTIMTKICLILTYLLWLLTCKYWYKLVILIPLVFSFFQLIIVLSDEFRFADVSEIYLALLFSLPIAFILFFVYRKLTLNRNLNVHKSNIDLEIREILKINSRYSKSKLNESIEEFEELKQNKNDYEANEYLIKLISLKDRIY